jgi:uroporphyrinogen-III decarboxylase
LELPKAKAVAYLHQGDIFRAKEILGTHMCIMGGLQPGLLKGGSPQEIDDYRRKLVDVCGKGGGFILVGRPPKGYVH